MELPQIGKHCSVADCKQLDFLPLACACKVLFCRDHFAEHVEKCTVANEVRTVQPPSASSSYLCCKEGCGDTSIVPLVCEKCNRHFCVAHRHIIECEQVDEEQLKAAIDKCDAPRKLFREAKANVDKQIENALKTAKRRETANKVQLMRLKAKATGSKSIPTSDRVYFMIYNSQYCNDGLPTFVACNWTVGRTVDAIAALCKIPNNNNQPTAPKLRLFRKSDRQIVSSVMLDKLDVFLNSSFIVNGDSLVIDYLIEMNK